VKCPVEVLPVPVGSGVHRNCESRTDLGHPAVVQTTDPINKHTYGDALDRIEIDGGYAT
jgi:hypothetical protein